MGIQDWKVNQVLTGFIASFGGFAFGCGLAWSATAIPSLEETGHAGDLTSTEKSWIGSLLAIGALVGCPIAGYAMNRIGRKLTLWTFSAVGFAGWTLLALAKKPLYLYLGRLLTGASTGGYTIVIPVFVSEIASKENRGLIGSFFLVMLCLGKLFSNVVGVYFPANSASILCGIHPILYSFLLILIPETPKSLSTQNKHEEAYKARTWLEQTGLSSPFYACAKSKLKGLVETPDLENQSKQNNQQIPKVSFKEFRSSPELVKPVVIIIIQMVFAQFCGINVSTFYTVEIFELSGDQMFEAKMATVILAIIQMIGCLPCSMLVDKYGRKLLLMSSFLAMGLAMGGFTAYFYMQLYYPTILAENSILSWVPLGSLVIFNLAYSWGVGSIVWIVMSEILPPKIIGPASSLANATFWGCAFLITQAFQMFRANVELYVWFLGFTICCFLGFLFNLMFLPETKGQTLEEIQAAFKNKSELKKGTK